MTTACSVSFGATLIARYSISACRAFAPGDLDSQRVALIASGQSRDALRHGRREHQRAPVRRRGVENELQILAEAEVEHLVGFVEHHRGKAGGVESAALDVIAQAPGRADDDMRAFGQLAALEPRIHAADAGHEPRAGVEIEPLELARDLQGELARGRDDQRERNAGRCDLGLRREWSRRSPTRRRPSCRNPSGRKRACPAPRPRRSEPRTAREWDRCSFARQGPGPALGWFRRRRTRVIRSFPRPRATKCSSTAKSAIRQQYFIQRARAMPRRPPLELFPIRSGRKPP